MAGCDNWALLKAFEVLLSVSCLIYKWWTDEEASRLYFYLEKRSREWPLLKNVTWNQAGSWFADVTFGGYTIITIALFIAHVIGELRDTRRTELFLLGIGSLLFFGCGCMIITSFDNVPESLFDNAIILGLLAILTGFIFLIDIGCFNRRERDKTDKPEKERKIKREVKSETKELKKEKEKQKEKPSKQNETVDGNAVQDKVISELRSSIKKKKPAQEEPSHKVENEKQTKENVQYGRKYLDNRGFKKKSIDEHDNAYDYDEQSIKNYDTESSSESDTERKNQGSQTSRSYVLEEKRISKKKSKDAQTITDTHIVEIQSSKVTTTNPNKSDTPTSEENFELHPPASSSYLLSKNGKKFQPILSTSRIERLTQTAQELNQNGSIPSSPTDPGYVLHTASKWPNTTPLAPQSYQQFKEKNKVLRQVHSAV